MKSTLAFVCAALTGSSAIAQASHSQPITEQSEPSSPVSEVFFAFDSARLPGDMPDLSRIVEWAELHPGGTIVLDGNACATGPATYNVRLSARRAESVRDRLVAMGVDADRIVLAFYGEQGLRRARRPLDRRVTIWTTQDPLYAIVDASLVRGVAVLWNRPVSLAELHPAVPEVATR
jgi:outer membrane protein OmpA-like peptidoglycan-associated protein